MAAVSTIYDIKVNFDVRNTRRTGLAMRSMTSIAATGLKTIAGLGIAAGVAFTGAAVAAGLAIREGIRFNSELEQMKITMAGLLQLNRRGDFHETFALSNQLVERFRKTAIASTGTMKDFAGFATLITGPLTRAGASMDDLAFITERGVIAAKAFGIEGEVAARDIEQALAGTLSKKDRFARALLEPMGITTKLWNKMVKETPIQAVELLRKAFEQSALKDMAKAQEKSWAGVVSTFTDLWQQFRAGVAAPLFNFIKDQLNRINQFWIKNFAIIQAIGKWFGGTLMEVVQDLTGGIQKAFSQEGFLKFADGLRLGFLNTLDVLQTIARIGINLGREVLSSFVLPMTKTLLAATGIGIKVGLISGGDKELDDIAGLIKTVDNAKLKISSTTSDELYKSIGLDRDFSAEMVDKDYFQVLGAQLAKSQAEEEKNQLSKKRQSPRAPGKQDISVNINRIEVSSEDPDRFAFNLVNAFEDIVRNPAQAADVISET